MRTQALFINGIFRDVLEGILKNQPEAPDKTLFLQPYSGSPIVMLRNNPPTIEDPVRLYASTTDDLATVSYTADIVGWEDKTKLERARRDEVARIIMSSQRTEDGLYDSSSAPGRPSLNLLSIRKLVRLTPPFSVANLIKISDSKPLSTNRSRSGGWSYVRRIASGPSDPVSALISARETAMVDSGIFAPDSLEDARERIAASIVRRRGQPEFRRKLLEAYGRRCAVTGCDVEEALEACHIIPYQGSETDHVTNGLLLRADLHTLFDLGLIAFDPDTKRVLVAARLRGTHYESLGGVTMNMPPGMTLRPSRTALECHRRLASL